MGTKKKLARAGVGAPAAGGGGMVGAGAELSLAAVSGKPPCYPSSIERCTCSLCMVMYVQTIRELLKTGGSFWHGS